jgi:hypothetical protein
VGQALRELRFSSEGWTLNLLYLFFRLDERATELQPRRFDPRVENLADKELGHGGSSVWTHLMLYGSASF